MRSSDEVLARREAKVRAKVEERKQSECSHLEPMKRMTCEATMYGKVDGGIIWSEDWLAVIGAILGLIAIPLLILGAFALGS